MSSISTPTQTSETSASAEVERGLVVYPVDNMQKSDNLPAVQLKTRLDVFEDRLTEVEGTVTAIRDDVKAIRSHVSNIQQDMTRVQGDVTGFITDIRVLREALGREMDSLCVVVLNIDSRSKKSRQDRAKVNNKIYLPGRYLLT
ncbi:hypothetical protein E4U40_007742 [Claviceps sp. LM458 group G5]|nr:hypothetical protein E4U40_007742 [Claviceps sp. LM458 group G5]